MRKKKVKLVRYQQLLYSTTPRLNIRLHYDSLIVKISCYDKDGLVVNRHSNVLMKLKCVIRFTNKK